jgi:hypothetical protein
MTVETVLDRAAIRERLKKTTEKEFTGAHTKAEMEQMMETMAVANDLRATSKTKADMYQHLVLVAKLPDPKLRGRSKVDSPVARAWQIADEMHAKATPEAPARRKDVVAAMQEAGITYYTARTQYQAFYKATDKGAKRLGDLSQDELPKFLREDVDETEE